MQRTHIKSKLCFIYFFTWASKLHWIYHICLNDMNNQAYMTLEEG